MEPSKPADLPPKTCAKLAGEGGDWPTARLRGVQFGLLPSSLISGSLSVIADKDETNRRIGITRAQDLFDPRLGVPNKERKCATCGGTSRGSCDRPSSCDGHFGHVALSARIYHPLYVKRLPKFLSSICLGCSRVLEKKKRANDLEDIFNRESDDEVNEGDDDEVKEDLHVRKSAPKRKVGARASGGASRKRKHVEKRSDMTKWLQQLECREWVDSSEQVKLEPMEIPAPAFPQDVSETPRPERGKEGHPNDGASVVCQHCGGPDGNKSKFPKMKAKLVSKPVGKRAKVDTIQIVVNEKAGVLPPGFWDFLAGHPIGGQEKTRPLLAFEALTILQKIPDDMTPMRCPAAFVISDILVSPNCNRLVMEDWSSTLQPRVLQRRSGQTNKLEAIVRKSGQFREASTRPDFLDAQRDSEELQLLAARLFRACKVVEYKVSTGQEVEQTGGTLELKWLKANVLGKRSNYSARAVINGDPCLRIEQIGIPREIAQRLTVQEKINKLNMRKWQEFVDGYMISDNVSMPGALIWKKKKETYGRDLELLRSNRKYPLIKLGLGDTISRYLKDGDRVFANRNPSLHKHSLATLKVKVHSLSTFAMNPLLCPPFDADFDGDSFHIFVPQSVESHAETQDLMTVSAQMISSQGGQPIIGLTQDTLVAGHLLTSGHVFINSGDMEQLSMWCSSQIPVPAIVKTPTKTGPLWTGKQLFGMTLPGGLNYGTPDWTGSPLGVARPSVSSRRPEEDVRILDGEVLICQGGAKWLDRSPDGVIRAICNHAGPVATVEHLDCLQGVLHQWLVVRGFSVGLHDFYAAEGTEARKNMRKGIQKSLEKSNEASLSLALRLDRQCQHRKLYPIQGGTSGFLEVEEHQGSFGLLLGDKNCTPRVSALQLAAIERFQALAPDVDNLVSGYMNKNNSLLAMVESGSKGSMLKLTQQVGCLGLQLYKGERLLPIRRTNKLSYHQTTLDKFAVSSRTEKNAEGYWESRGIIHGSYLDGLNSREFFMDSMSSRCNVLRQGIEEPNQILKNLMLFMRDMKIAYDGTVRMGSSQTLIQFQYGTAGRSSPDKVPEDHCADSELAGEPVGVLAATSIAEPAYNVKMQSIHQTQVLGTGPIQLLKEVLTTRAKTKIKVNDRRSILRLPHGFGKERRALEIQRQLQRVTLQQITLACAIQYVTLDRTIYVKPEVKNELGEDSPPFFRLSPWMGHIQLCKLKPHLDQGPLQPKCGRCAMAEDEIANMAWSMAENFGSEYAGQTLYSENTQQNTQPPSQWRSDLCESEVHPDEMGLCIWFFPVDPLESMATTNREQSPLQMPALLESMETVILPAVLNTTIRGSHNIEKVRVFWESSGAASRIAEEGPSHVGQHSTSRPKRRDFGELAIEVIMKASKGAGKRGATWMNVREACIPVMNMIDWSRSTPYGVQELVQSYGVEAARHVILKRLTLATKVMGKPVHQKHMILVADTMTHCGEVTGLGSAGYREFCRHLSISAPFTQAAFQQPKKAILDAAAAGAAETIDGVLTSAVWGSRVPLGTGAEFRINPKELKVPPLKWPRDPLELWSELITRKKRTRGNGPVEKSMKTQSLFQKYKHTESYLDMIEDFCFTKAPIIQSSKLAEVMLGDGKDFTKATIFQSGAADEGEDSGDILLDSTASPADKNVLSDNSDEEGQESMQDVNMTEKVSTLQDRAKEGSNRVVECVGGGIRAPASKISLSESDEEDKQEPKEKVNWLQQSSTLQEGTNEGCNGRVEDVESGIKAPALEGDKISGGKRMLHTLEEGTDADDQPATKIPKQDVSAVVPRLVTGSHTGIWSGCADVPVAEEVKVGRIHVKSNVFYQESSESNTAPVTDEISEASTSFKGATVSVAGSMSSDSGDFRKRRESVDDASVPSSKRMWPLNILAPFRSLFKSSKKVEIEEPAATEGKSQSERDGLSNGVHQHTTSLNPGNTGSRDHPAPSEVAVASTEQEQEILGQKKKLQHLLHVRYGIGDRVEADHKKVLVEDVLAHHPQRELKIGCGVDYIMVDYHPDHPESKCFHIVRKDGSRTDFSFHKCLDSKLLKLSRSKQMWQLFDVS